MCSIAFRIGMAPGRSARYFRRPRLIPDAAFELERQFHSTLPRASMGRRIARSQAPLCRPSASPPLCPVGMHPKLKTAASREPGEFVARLGLPEFNVGERHVGIDLRWYRPMPTTIPTFPGYQRTTADRLGASEGPNN
jgi:hypothetical protein